MGGSWVGRLRGTVGARSRKEKTIGVAALALIASAPFGGLDRAGAPRPEAVRADHPVAIGPYKVTFLRAYRVKQFVGSRVQDWQVLPIKPSAKSRRLLIVEADVANRGVRPEFAQVLTGAVRFGGASPVSGFRGPSSQPSLVYRADGSNPSIMGPGLTHRVALIVEQPAGTTSGRVRVTIKKLIYVGKDGLASNLDGDYWLQLDGVARRGSLPVTAAPKRATS